jgi:OOP family OmpA-OmpF porin
VKPLVSALAALAAAMIVTSTTVSAADIDVAPEPVVENNWYASLHGGWKFGEDWESEVDLDVCFIFCLITIDEVEVTAETDDGWRIGGSIGYVFNEWFALEGELSYLNQDFESLDIESISGSIFGFPFSKECNLSFCSDIGLDGDISIFTGMINAIVGVPIGGWLRPYMGVGAGAAHVSFEDVGFSDYPSICCLDDSDTTFAWQLIAGADVRVARNVALGGRFRALNIGDIDLEDDADFDHNVDPEWMKSLELVLSFGF